MTDSPQFLDLGEWIKQEYGDQGALASALRPKVAKNTVSSWKTGRNGIPPEYQKQLRKLGYDGPWPEQGGEVTLADLESLRAEVRTQAAWVREELRKENAALAADLERALNELVALRDSLSRATS